MPAKKKTTAASGDYLNAVIGPGDAFSKFAGDIARASYNNCPWLKVIDLSKGHFRGPRGYEHVGLPEGCIFTGAADGTGTKTILTSVVDDEESQRGLGYDLVAMVSADISRFGGMMFGILNVLDVHSLGDANSPLFEKYQNLMLGLGDAAREVGAVILSGETAVLGKCVGSDIPTEFLSGKDAYIACNWAAAGFGVYNPKWMIDGSTMRPGQVIIAFRDNCRANGISAIRRYLSKKHGREWWQNPDARTEAQMAAKPSKLFDPLLYYLNGWNEDLEQIVRVHGVAHLSGGSIIGKFADDLLFTAGLSADLHDLFDPPEVMRAAAESEGYDDIKSYTVFGGGQCALIVVDQSDVQHVLGLATRFGIDAKIAGYIRKLGASRKPEVKITSKFSDKQFTYVSPRAAPRLRRAPVIE